MSAPEPRRTKIVATIGPASATKETIRALVDAGMDGARLNFSHGTREHHAEWARLVREVQEEVRRPLALIADLQGPKLRVGDIEGTLSLERGEEIVVAGGKQPENGVLPVSAVRAGTRPSRDRPRARRAPARCGGAGCTWRRGRNVPGRRS